MLVVLPLFLATRLDWGFGNANKTAGLIVLFLVVAWVVPFVRERYFWPTLAICTGLGVCLLLTASRGGFVAAFVSLAVLLSRVPRPWARIRIVGGVTAIWIVFGVALWLPISQRFSKGIGGDDLSISQRLELWSAAPRMMVDASCGWGRGQAAAVFHQWYQPLEHSQTFLSLVNSHLTWMVEMSWPGRVLYVFGWLATLLVCWPASTELPRARWRMVPFALWLAFAICSWFSSVAESLWLWIIPMAGLLASLTWRCYYRRWPIGRRWLATALVTCAVLGLCLILGTKENKSVRLRYLRGRIVAGDQHDPAVWIVTSDPVLGSSYGRTFRKCLADSSPAARQSNQTISVGFVPSVGALLPAEVQGKALVIAGAMNEQQLAQVSALAQSCSKLILLNPGFYPQQLAASPQTIDKMMVIAGEFSQTPGEAWTDYLHRPIRTVEGAGMFLSRWPELVLTSNSDDSPWTNN